MNAQTLYYQAPDGSFVPVHVQPSILTSVFSFLAPPSASLSSWTPAHDEFAHVSPQAHLSWMHVLTAFAFVALNALLSRIYGLHIEVSLLSAAARCVGQLALAGTLLAKVFESQSPWIVGLIAFVLNLLGTFETVVNKSQRRHQNMFASVLAAMLGSTIPVSILGARFAMGVEPFWVPAQYIPIVGMMCGSTISGMVVSLNYVLKELYEDRDKVEVYLAYGATRREACKPIVIDALVLALTPSINQMSVLGIISIPGMMTGAILGGSSVEQAVKMQVVIMFMISSSTALASILTTGYAISIVVDGEYRVRVDRIYTSFGVREAVERWTGWEGKIRRAREWWREKRTGMVGWMKGKRGIGKGDETRGLYAPIIQDEAEDTAE